MLKDFAGVNKPYFPGRYLKLYKKKYYNPSSMKNILDFNDSTNLK